MMKTHYLLPALLALGTAITSTQAMAELSYDPYDNYYSKYYGIGEGSTATQAKAESEPTFYDPYNDYYNTYYDMDNQLNKYNLNESNKATEVTSTDDADMANPLNYYKW